MSGCRITVPARRDLVELQIYLMGESVDAAERVMDRFRQAFDDLAANPGIGHRRDDLTRRDVRFLAVGSYLIIYRHDTQPVEVLRVVHGARDVRSALDA